MSSSGHAPPSQMGQDAGSGDPERGDGSSNEKALPDLPSMVNIKTPAPTAHGQDAGDATTVLTEEEDHQTLATRFRAQPKWKQWLEVAVSLATVAGLIVAIVAVVLDHPPWAPPPAPPVEGAPPPAPTPPPTTTAPSEPKDDADPPPPSPPPTSSPIVVDSGPASREEAIRTKISSVSGGTTPGLPGSPQGQALSWLTHVDRRALEADDPSLEQRYGLALLYYALGGPTWTSSNSWLGGLSECEWEHVTCDEDGRVNEIALGNNQCEGEIPDEIFLFEKLEKLSFSQSNVYGVLPQSLFELGNLKFLELGDTKVSGSIPGDIGNLSNLQHLDMFNTDLSGALPLDELSGLSDLEVLHLGTDNIRGWVNYFERLESNYERRSMPSSIRNLRKLKYLRINAGALSGTIPSEIGELTSLVSLQLYSNFLTGTIPSTIGNLAGLRALRLNINNLTGTIPLSLSTLSSLDTLRIEVNEELSGTLPTEICTETAVPSTWGVWVTCNIQCCVDCCSLCFPGGRQDDLPCS